MERQKDKVSHTAEEMERGKNIKIISFQRDRWSNEKYLRNINQTLIDERTDRDFIYRVDQLQKKV